MQKPTTGKPAADEAKIEYACPGELGTISYSLHLARLSVGFLACRECQFRHATGSLPKNAIDKDFAERNVENRLLVTSEGIRGVYLNEITRDKLSRVVESILNEAESRWNGIDLRSQPKLLVGYDWRTSSEDLAVAVVGTLRRWGCDTVDVGRVNQPCFEFALNQFRPDLAIFVTGGTFPDKFNGLNVYESDGMPMSLAADQFGPKFESFGQAGSRFSRRAGRYETIPVSEIYNAAMTLTVTGAYPVCLAYACGDPLTKALLENCFNQSDIEAISLPNNFAELRLKKQLSSFRYGVRDQNVDLGILIRPDGQSIHVFDERGRELLPLDVVNLCRLRPEMIDELANGQAVEKILASGALAQESVATNEQGRYWFLDRTPQCDAMNVVKQLLELIGQIDVPFSALVEISRSESRDQASRDDRVV